MSAAPTTFTSLPPSPNGTVSWIHLGDLHMVHRGDQNEIDLGRIVDEINRVYARGGVDFVFVPGDVADDGSLRAYEVVREHLDRLQLPWCAVVGDHDVHEKSFANFRQMMAPDLHSSFQIGRFRFFRLNTFSEPAPDTFYVDSEQLVWLEAELQSCREAGETPVILMHCYPSDLKQGGAALSRLLRDYSVLVVDMGHTHYNEISNDGTTLYTATRSTGQIEEGPVGYSLTTIDGDAVSWHFVRLGSPRLVNITQPSDARLERDSTGTLRGRRTLTVHAKVWSNDAVTSVHAVLQDARTALELRDGLWTGEVSLPEQPFTGDLTVVAEDVNGEFSSNVRISTEESTRPPRAERDQDNALGEWLDRDLLGTQLGPNKNGKKW